MAQTLEEIRKELKLMSDEELSELITHNRRERSTTTKERVQAVRKKTREKNVKAAVDGMDDSILLEIARRRNLLKQGG